MNIPQPYSSPFTEAFDKAVQVYLPDGGVIGTVTDPNAVPIDFIPHMAQYIGGNSDNHYLRGDGSAPPVRKQ